jgi:DNA-binding MarR family transcriptional regulator
VQASNATTDIAATGDLVYRLMRAIMLTPEEDRYKAIEENDLTVSQVRALVTLACADPDPVSGGRIAERIGASPAAVSRALDGLVQKGFVTRRESTADRRVRLFAITARGHELADDLVALRRAQIDRFLSTLTPDERDRIHDAIAPLAAADRIAGGAGTEETPG